MPPTGSLLLVFLVFHPKINSHSGLQICREDSPILVPKLSVACSLSDAMKAKKSMSLKTTEPFTLFEPMASNLAILRSKLSANDSRLSIIHSAIADYDGVAKFVGTGKQQTTMEKIGSYTGAHSDISTVPVQRLDSYCANESEHF